MKILVTGANGYLGRGVVEQLLLRGHEVIATDMKTTYVSEKAKKVECDLFKIENPYFYFGKPDVLLHMAWRDGFVHNSDAHINDLPLHYRFIKLITEAGLKKVAIMGSMHEVGFFEGSINENTPCHPMNLYGIAKDSLRNVTKLIATQNNILWQWLRGYYIVSNSPIGNSIFSKIVKAVGSGQTEFPFTMGQNQYDFLDYNEFCFQVAAVLSQDKTNGIINICSGKPEKLADRVERFIRENNYKIKLKYGAFPDRPYDSKAVWGDSTKIEKILKNS